MIVNGGQSMGASAALARFAAELRYADIPSPVVRRAEDLFLDWLASAFAGGASAPEIERLIRLAWALAGQKQMQRLL